jgi:ribose transport system permease protein
MREMIKRVGRQPTTYLALALVVMLIVFGVTIDDFTSVRNLSGIAAASAALGVMAVGATLALGAGAVDFSIAGTASLVGAVTAVAARSVGPVASIAIGLGVALAIGLFNALLTVRLEVNAFIATLAMAGSLRGLAFVVTGSVGVFIADGPLTTIGQQRVGDVPLSAITFALLGIAGHMMLQRTTVGRSMLVVGESAPAARLAGIRVARLQTLGYLISAVGAGLAGLILLGRAGVAVPQAAADTELLVFSAVLLGGTSLNGGRASVAGSVLSILLLNTLYTGLLLLSISPYLQTIIQGVVLLVAVRLALPPEGLPADLRAARWHRSPKTTASQEALS